MRVHYVEVEGIRAGLFRAADFVSEPTVVGSKKRWQYL
jgi:hypothetical protein